MKDAASEVKVVTAIQPQTASGESVDINGITIDRLGYEGAVFACQIGNAGGDVAPTRFGVTFKVQHKSGETDWVDVAGKTFTVSGETVASESTVGGEINVDLKGCARYVRAVVTPTFTAGTNPNLDICSTVVLGEAQVGPAT
jgi:hypothetical protein